LRHGSGRIGQFGDTAQAIGRVAIRLPAALHDERLVDGRAVGVERELGAAPKIGGNSEPGVVELPGFLVC